jgi:hypothetical protein
MTEEMANAFDEFSPTDLEIHDDYSGRGMDGKQTFAVCFDSEGEFLRALVDVAFQVGFDNAVMEDCADSTEVWRSQMESLAKELRKGFATDSLGTGIVVY